jgi:hypothetical protein
MRKDDVRMYPLRTGRPERSFFESYVCKVCGKHKGSGNHRPCSVILKQLNKEKEMLGNLETLSANPKLYDHFQPGDRLLCSNEFAKLFPARAPKIPVKVVVTTSHGLIYRDCMIVGIPDEDGETHWKSAEYHVAQQLDLGESWLLTRGTETDASYASGVNGNIHKIKPAVRVTRAQVAVVPLDGSEPFQAYLMTRVG